MFHNPAYKLCGLGVLCGFLIRSWPSGTIIDGVARDRLDIADRAAVDDLIAQIQLRIQAESR